MLGLARGLRFPVPPFDLALLAAFLLLLLVDPHPFGLGLAALGGGFQQAGGFGPLGLGDGADGLAVQIVAAVAAMVEQGQQVAIPVGVVGQRPA